MFTARHALDPALAGREHIALYLRHLMTPPPSSSAGASALDPSQRLSNATIQQRLTAIRLYDDFLMDEGDRITRANRELPTVEFTSIHDLIAHDQHAFDPHKTSSIFN